MILRENTYTNRLEEVENTYAYRNFKYLEKICRKKIVSCFDPHKSIYESKDKVYDSGIRWVEWIHFTSYGQEVFAKSLYPKLKEVLDSIYNQK